MHQGIRKAFWLHKVSLFHVLTIGLGFGLVNDLQLLLVEDNCKINHQWLSIFHIDISTIIKKGLRPLNSALEKWGQKLKCCVYNFVQCSLCFFMLILLAKNDSLHLRLLVVVSVRIVSCLRRFPCAIDWIFLCHNKL